MNRSQRSKFVHSVGGAPRPRRIAIEAAPGANRATRVLLRPAAFLKLMFCCHAAATEIGGFGIGEATDLLAIESFALVRQSTSAVTVEFDDASVADHVDRYADAGIGPERSMRVWIHTHPGSSASPSGTDEQTFARSFGTCDWSAMLIQSRATERYCRLQFNAGPGGEAVIPVEFDWAGLPTWLLDHAEQLGAFVQAWRDELQACVTVRSSTPTWRDDQSGVDRGVRFLDPFEPFEADGQAFEEDLYEDRQLFREEGLRHDD